MSLIDRVASRVEGRFPARPMAVARIGAAAAILLELRNSAETLLRLAEPGVIRAPWFGPEVPVTEPIAWLVIGVWLAANIGLLLGFRTRLSGALLTVMLAFTLLADQQLYSNHLYLMTVVAGLLCIGDSGAALSLDARRGGARTDVPAWPVLLLKLQISVVYGYAALSKLNPDFLSGSVVASYLRRDGPLALPADWRSVEPMLVLSVLAICMEGFLAVALWLPRWRHVAFPVALALHVGIAIWLTPTYALSVFSLFMLPLLVLFLDPAPGRLTLVWDDGCGFCGAWVRWFRRLDWLDAIRPVPRSGLAASGLPVAAEAAARALQAVEGDRVRGGFAAVTAVAEALPLAFLWAPLLRLPPVAWIGERWYARVAARRSCELPGPTLTTRGATPAGRG
jgi:predicted DCC family thiol-disulfide oxidoreductase YuxK